MSVVGVGIINLKKIQTNVKALVGKNSGKGLPLLVFEAVAASLCLLFYKTL